MSFIENYIGVNHFITVLILLISMIFIYKLFKRVEFKNIIIALILFELGIFYFYLFINGEFSFKENLPLEMCYLTQISILFYFLFNIKSIKPLLFFNSISGAIAGYLNINNKDYESIKAIFIKDMDSAYKILEIDSSASDGEVKKAYRKMAVKYHPDKVAHLVKEIQRTAEEKFKAVSDAYNEIKKQRTIS